MQNISDHSVADNKYMQVKTHTISLPGEQPIILSTGKIANLAAGAVMVQKGGTVVLGTAAVDASATDKDFFPLTVEYIERYYSTGTISGSKVKKREGFPTDDAVIQAREIDHALRPLFPKAFKNPVNVIVMCLADDGVNSPHELAMISASAALHISEIPFAGPASSVVVGFDSNNQVVFNPAHNGDTKLKGHFSIAAAAGKLLNIEGDAKELADTDMDQIIDAALARIALLNQAQQEFAQGITKSKLSVNDEYVASALVEYIEQNFGTKLKEALFDEDKVRRDNNVNKVKDEILAAEDAKEESEFSKGEISEALDYVSRKFTRQAVLAESKRLSNRGLEQIRELKAEVDVLPTVHGSALFSRGLTQSLSIVTLGSTSKSVGIDDMSGTEIVKGFMHHYNFPPFSTGEAGKVKYSPGRREIGHGAIGENGIKHLIPNQEVFPYTIRVVSEIMTSNGSTSMAATCAASLALMAAGVPLPKLVGGIGVGLVTAEDNDANYKLLLDIEGAEDFYGDMDFKVTGTRDGLTAIQFETKLPGVKPEIIKQAFRLANKGRQQVLDVMETAISEPRSELAETAPRVEVISIATDKIGELIGPGGKMIRGIIEDAEKMSPGQVEIDIDDDGRVTITASNKAQHQFVMQTIRSITNEPEIGMIYDAKVDKIMEYGAFVDIFPNLTGLVHISEIAKERVNDVKDYLKEGQDVKVKLIKSERGKLSFSIKQAQE